METEVMETEVVVSPQGSRRPDRFELASGNGLGREVLTSGQAAKACRVAPRTMVKWFTKGLVEGYVLPDSKDRRINRESLILFMRARMMPIPEWLETGSVSLGVWLTTHEMKALGESYQLVSPYYLGYQSAKHRIRSLVIGDQWGLASGIELAKTVLCHHPSARVAIIVGEDVIQDQSMEDRILFFRRSVDWAEVLKQMS